jgi:glycine cleavage system pyridoxal-binding protein P
MSNEDQNQKQAPGREASDLTHLLAGKVSIELTPQAFAIQEANKAMATMVAYEGQYKNSVPSEIRRRILSFSDFIETETKKIAGG